ncbi:MAG TPA: hypothetical protein VMD79_08770 [Solirubrobacteraceae bacterium]|nr:hypothetical protein [Solirubrobacteraceae bacterium]
MSKVTTVERDASKTASAVDDEVQAILASGAAGVETAIRALEGAEQVYYGAVAATETGTVITTTNVTPYSPDPAA